MTQKETTLLATTLQGTAPAEPDVEVLHPGGPERSQKSLQSVVGASESHQDTQPNTEVPQALDDLLQGVDGADLAPENVSDKQVRHWNGEIRGYLRASVQRAVLIGRVLIHKKETLNGGLYTLWVEETLGLSARTARLYKQVADAVVTAIKSGNALPVPILDMPLRDIPRLLAGKTKEEKPAEDLWSAVKTSLRSIKKKAASHPHGVEFASAVAVGLVAEEEDEEIRAQIAEQILAGIKNKMGETWVREKLAGDAEINSDTESTEEDSQESALRTG